MLTQLPESQAKVVGREVEYFKCNRAAWIIELQKRGEPLGSEAIESIYRQYQYRFKRPAQFWATEGDVAIMCLGTFGRNGRWNQLFPHVGDFDPCKKKCARYEKSLAKSGTIVKIAAPWKIHD
jgi:hypothetical protein